MTNKVRIKLVTIGHPPQDLHVDKVKAWKSSIFQLSGTIENFALRRDSDGADWEFSDSLITEILPSTLDADLIVALVNVPIEDGWYTRLIENNKIVITLHEIKYILKDSDIPLENVVLRLLYAFALVFRRCGNQCPTLAEGANLFHDETRGCIFDFTPYKAELPASCDKPQICDECQERLRQGSVSNDVIENSKREIQKIRKEFYYRILEFVKNHPVQAFIYSSAYAVLLNIVASIIYSK